MWLDKNGMQLEHFDIVYEDNSGIHGGVQSHYALVIKDLFSGELKLCSKFGITQISRPLTEKVAHFPSERYHLSDDVKYAYIGYLKNAMAHINNQMVDFVKQANRIGKGVRKRGRGKEVLLAETEEGLLQAARYQDH